MEIQSLDNISEKVLDALAEKYKDDPTIKVMDERKILSFGKPREYFLIRNHNRRADLEWTFIWIGDNLWQFSYMNTQCGQKASWVDPLTLLNSLL
jgi:hypothetical protein